MSYGKKKKGGDPGQQVYSIQASYTVFLAAQDQMKE